MIRLIAASLLVAVLAGCGGDINLTCDKPMLYQEARQVKRIEAPEGLSDLDETREMPVPSASPAPPREAGQPCLDIPPRYLEEGEVVKPGTI